MFYPLITNLFSFALKFKILISFSNAMFLQFERIINTIHLCGLMRISIKSVGKNINSFKKSLCKHINV